MAQTNSTRSGLDASDIRAAAVKVTMYFQFFCGKEIVVLRVKKIDHGRFLCFRFTVWALNRYWDTVADQEILLLVDLQKRGSGQASF